MSLNIKNERVHDLAREAARVTGKSQTAAIQEALEELLRQRGADPEGRRIEQKVERVRRLVAEYAADLGQEGPPIRRIEDLYDEVTGLPR